MKVWLTGAEGMLGHAFSSWFRKTGVDWVATDRDLDITDESRVMRFAAAHRPALVVNAAAYTDVDGAEHAPDEAWRVNGLGPGYLAAAARAQGAKLVHFSTDYVFDGERDTPYDEASEPAPRNEYGRSKLEGERRVLAAARGPDWGYVVRTSWLFGPGARHFVATVLELAARQSELRIVDDQWGRPTYAPDLAAAVMALVERSAPAGLYHFANAGAASWHGLASRVVQQARWRGLPVLASRVTAIRAAELSRPAARPAYSVLATARYAATVGCAPRPWEMALDDYFSRWAREAS